MSKIQVVLGKSGWIGIFGDMPCPLPFTRSASFAAVRKDLEARFPGSMVTLASAQARKDALFHQHQYSSENAR